MLYDDCGLPTGLFYAFGEATEWLVGEFRGYTSGFLFELIVRLKGTIDIVEKVF